MNHPRSYRTAMALLAAVLATGPVAAASPKQPWEMTAEEHAATRVAHDVEAPANAAAGFSDGKPVVVLEGSRNPAAFMPGELFNQLILTCYLGQPDVQAGFRTNLLAAAVSQGFGKNFFKRLEEIVSPVVAKAREAQTAARAGDLAGANKAQANDCRDRAIALERAYTEFGRDHFLRFLYQGVAPGMSMTTDVTSRKELLWVEGGCR